jgi:tripartite-type tricarboxylate transporter receptor subunit TctC
MTKLPYGSPADFSAIIRLASNPCLLAVKSNAPWKTIQEFIDYARANPGKIRVGNSGIGTQLHLDAEMLRLMAKIDLVAVPFAGSGESVPAMLGGHVEVSSTHPNNVLGHVQAGKVRVLAVFEEKRNPLFPEAPTFKEIGYEITTAVYYQFIGPKGLPPQIVSTLHDAFKKGMEDPAFVKPMATQGWQIDYEGPQDLMKRLMKDYEMNTKLVDLLNLKGKGH